MVVQHDEIKKLLKGNNLDGTNEWIVYGTKGDDGYWLVLSDHGITVLPVAAQGNLTGEIMPHSNDEIKSVFLKKGILTSKLIITDIKDKEIIYKVASRHLGNKYHHQDFMKIVKKYGK